MSQLALSPESRWERARVVLVRTDLLWAPPRRVEEAVLRPVLMIVGHANLPEDFSRHEADLDGLLARITFDVPGAEGRTAVVMECAPGAPRVRLRVGPYGRLMSPDVDDGGRDCVGRALSGVPLEAGRSYGFRREAARFSVPTD